MKYIKLPIFWFLTNLMWVLKKLNILIWGALGVAILLAIFGVI